MFPLHFCFSLSSAHTERENRVDDGKYYSLLEIISELLIRAFRYKFTFFDDNLTNDKRL